MISESFGTVVERSRGFLPDLGFPRISCVLYLLLCYLFVLVAADFLLCVEPFRLS